MRISVDISYYPLHDEFIPHILSFINRLKSYPELMVVTNGLSTQVFGNYDNVMTVLTTEIREAFNLPGSVFVIKMVNADQSN